MAKQLFYTKENDGGWMGFGYRPVKVWEKDTADEFSRFMGRTKVDEKKYRNCIRRCKGTPGSRAGVALYLNSDSVFLRKHLLGFRGEWEPQIPISESLPVTTPFHDSMVAAGVASSNMVISMLECWERWCLARGWPCTEENFYKFSYSVTPDMELTQNVMANLNLFTSSFPSIYNPYPMGMDDDSVFNFDLDFDNVMSGSR